MAGIAAVAVGASLGWMTADWVSSRPSSFAHDPEAPPPHLPRSNSVPPRPPLPSVLAERRCSAPVVEGEPKLRLVEVARGLAQPLFVATPTDDPRLFVVEAAGRILIVENGRALHPPFFALPPRPAKSTRSEPYRMGTLAFHPHHLRNGRAFVSFIDLEHGLSRVVELRASSDPDQAEPSALPLLDVPLPTSGTGPAMLAFGPDGYLYVALGDGGEPSDPRHLAQRSDSRLGKILRVDVDPGDPAIPYAIPQGNLHGPRVRSEIWALGLHEPNGFSFDRRTGDLWLVDLGEAHTDEINLLPPNEAGLNLGWSFVEGSRCLPNAVCDTEGLKPPLVEFARNDDGCDLIGGFVYRGCRMPALSGEYFFGDRCGRIRSMRLPEGDELPVVRERVELPRVPALRSFGEDAEGELYLVSGQGVIHRLEPE